MPTACSCVRFPCLLRGPYVFPGYKTEEDNRRIWVVLTSVGPKHWSTGIDVAWAAAQLAQENVDAVKEFLRTMNRAFARLLT